ncbi:hypothetical protein [Bifidobacterium ruminantium]|uniref:hypothetical protein n=1 Tax=Bifidobacterium ruminantium TaxID=78346 RepID=UPI001EF6FAC4|nr:hypothetical protein [Bifidobacterium ruminantium]
MGGADELAAFHSASQCGILGLVVGIRASAFHDGFFDDFVRLGMILHVLTVKDGEIRGKRR